MEQPAEFTQGDGAIKYEKCVEWLPQLSAVKVEVTGKYTLPEGSDKLEKFHNFIVQFAGVAKEMALSEIASDSVKCKVKEGGPKPDRFPSVGGMHSEDNLSFRVHVTAVDRTDADVNILHIDKLQEDMRQAIMSGIYSNEKK